MKTSKNIQQTKYVNHCVHSIAPWQDQGNKTYITGDDGRIGGADAAIIETFNRQYSSCVWEAQVVAASDHLPHPTPSYQMLHTANGEMTSVITTGFLTWRRGVKIQVSTRVRSLHWQHKILWVWFFRKSYCDSRCFFSLWNTNMSVSCLELLSFLTALC